MFDFDDLGYITPYEVHELTLEEFERIFVIDYGRERLFKTFCFDRRKGIIQLNF